MTREKVLVRKVAELPAAITESLDFLDWEFTGQKVWVKPNLLGPHPPEHAATTDPELVRAVVRELKHRDAAEVIVTDNPGGRIRGGLAAFIESTGVPAASEGCFHGLDQMPVSLPLESRFVPDIPVTRLAVESDVIVNLPVFKTHALTTLTGAIKNMFGIIPGDHKSTLHGKASNASDFSELMVDIYQAVQVPMLHIMDALRGMDGQNGPNGGRPLSIGRLLSARNGVAMDTVMALMAGIEPGRVPMLRIAGERGLGPVTQDDIEIVGDYEKVKGFRLPAAGMTDALAALSGLYISATRREPVLERAKCTKCEQCSDSCPVDAIELRPWPVIDRKACISCFCCAEMCPTNAMTISSARRALWRRLTGR